MTSKRHRVKADKIDRAPIPVATQVKLLVLSRRRCCLCFGLNRDDAQKEGQIAHVDHDSSNADLDNLAFLCVHHHGTYDSVSPQFKGLMPGELKHYRFELHEHLSQLRDHPPELVLSDQELRKWVKQRQRVTLGCSLSVIPLVLILQMLWTSNGPVATGVAGAGFTMESLPKANGFQDLTPRNIVEPKLEPTKEKEDQRKALISTPVSDQPSEAGEENVDKDQEEPSDCTLNFRLETEGDQEDGDVAIDRIVLKFLCSRVAFEPGDVFYRGSITDSYTAQWTSQVDAFPAGQTLGLRWEDVEVRYIGSGHFAATEVLSVQSSSSLKGGGKTLFLQPSPVRLSPALYFDPLGNSAGLRLVFAFFILSVAVAWSSRMAWERYLVRRHHLTIGE